MPPGAWLRMASVIGIARVSCAFGGISALNVDLPSNGISIWMTSSFVPLSMRFSSSLLFFGMTVSYAVISPWLFHLFACIWPGVQAT